MYRRPEIVQTQDAITTTKQLIVEDRDEVLAAIDDFRAGTGHFADYLLGGAISRRGGTVTFDRKLKTAHGIRPSADSAPRRAAQRPPGGRRSIASCSSWAA
jgi:predicted nucleic-acid-binding protein